MVSNVTGAFICFVFTAAGMRIAIITESDTVWSLPAWERTTALLEQDGHIIVGIWTCPAILGRNRGSAVPIWYLRVFGVVDFLKLGLFALVANVGRLIGATVGSRVRSFNALAGKHRAFYGRCQSPNVPAVITWLQEEQIDILLITVGFILSRAVLAAPRLGTINKHAAALPANRGLFPYLWAKLHRTPQGVSYRLVTLGIDEGALLVQDRNIPAAALRSMVGFYLHVFRTFPERMREAIARLARGATLQPPADLTPSYHGLPTRKAVRAFRRSGGKIIAWSDLPRALALGRPQ